MDLLNKMLNIVALPFSLFSLCLLLPPFHFFKFALSILSSISGQDVVAGKVVIITGASSGIGEQLAYEYARRGACLVLAARREKSLREIANRCLELGSPDSISVTADVSNVDDCKRIVESTITRYGRLDHLVSNAGITSISMLEDYEDITIATSIMASKAAMVAFFETLRVELGSDIQITIATPGFVESEMTKGKHLAPEGLMNVDVNMRDVQVSVLPIASGQSCAKAIIDSVCRGDRYVTEPTWYRVSGWWKAFAPELVDWLFSVFYIAKLGDSPTDSLSKKILDLPGLRALVYPSSVYSPGVKTK
ncbi:11-beta-hydroxysteroid dehydrogenase 1A isoform X2 [Spinacia oleracea]|uniref:11-beta-hydroxysteroid dehydrogenase 1A isoform X2 n=1 Tax=Spinacia oleracea TaxID=3562 RepID=A0A9R0JDP2_SPIOL|nr:11-beta-hydroxysteroid dehydrogenase 1A-like isoform X2 [Spinacia oleracea]